MRNTITLNGVESSTIPGLLIQELPAISKPLMRTEVETIDGRDGDITTDLGFSAYDKQISIGLFGDFDIDQIIAYFNSKGTVIFSNEPDKFYNYEIVDQIDFERLVRYRTATVTMHCQPFKYSTTEAADILSTNSNFATLDQSINSDASNFSYSSNVQADVTATRTTTTGGGKFFATFTMNVAQGVTYYFSGNAANNCTMYGYKDRIWGTSAGFSGRKLPQFPSYTATYTGTLIIGFYSVTTEPVFIRNFKVSNQSVATVSGEGTNIILANTGEVPFNKLELKGNIEQDTFSGKNLLHYAPKTNADHGITTTYNSATGIIHVTGTATSTWADVSQTLYHSLPAGTYTFSVKLVSGTYTKKVCFRPNNIDRYCSVNDSVTFTNNNEITNYRVWIGTEANTTYDFYMQLQVESGSTATSFEKYVGGIPSPNPSYPQPVRVVTGHNAIRICGNNLLRLASLGQLSQGITSTITGGVIHATGTATSTWADIDANTGVYLPAGSYIFSIPEPLNVRVVLQLRFSDGTYLDSYINVGDKIKTITTTKQTTNAHLFITGFGVGDSINVTIKPQLELGSTATPFEPYREQAYPLDFGDTKLCLIDDAQDTIYKDGGNWYIHKTIGNMVTTGAETISFASPMILIANTEAVQGQNSTVVSSHARFKWANEVGACYVSSSSTNIAIGVSDISDVAGAKTWIENHTPEFYYKLKNPTEVQITDTTLISQLEAIAEANAYHGTTHIMPLASTGNAPHIIAAEVAADPSGTITNSGNIYSKPKLTIFGSGSVGVYLNGVQMFQIALDTNDHITIDTAIMEAYKDNLQTLKNRSVTGDYNNFKLPVGESEISFSGSVTMCVVENYSRWL